MIISFLSRNFFPLLLLLITLALSILNYQPGTFLSGWDTLHPEFNFPEYFKRIFFGVWQSHQGLGAISSQAHPSEFPRMLLYFPLSFLMPLSFLRYSYFFITLILGPLGVYFFVKKSILKEDSLPNKISSFGASLFYLLNLGTVQHYFVPLEMFATHFATLPWIFLFLTQFLEKSRKRDLVLFAIFTFFSASIAHTPTLWYTYFFSLLVFLTLINFVKRNRRIFLNSLKIIAITLSVNLFWILPNLYFITASGNSVSESKIHTLFTPEAFAQNKRFGTIQDILIFKNFLFDWSQYVGDGKFGPLLSDWIIHLQKPFVAIIGYFFSLIALIGIAYSVYKKNALSLSLLGILMLSVFFLLTTNPPFGFLFAFFQDTLPFFKEALRFPFTKFSILFMFTVSCFFAWGLSLFIRRFSLYLFIILIASLIYYALPAFQGKMIDPAMKVNIPSEYFSLFKWFKNQPEGRIASLPIHSFWGWTYYKWGYQGAGFIWFGLKGPILDREFDRWNPKNEQYYREMSQAIYSQDVQKLKNVLKKYDISYILLDKNIISPEQGDNPKILFLQETESLLAKASNIQKVFEKGELSVYETGVRSKTVRTIKNPVSVEPKTTALYDDFAYSKYNDYISYPDPKENAISFPFRNIIDNQNRLITKDIFSPLENKKVYDIFQTPDTNECPPASKKTLLPEKKIVTEKGEQFIRYSSFSGSFCDHYSFPNLLRNEGHLIYITSRNIKGLPFRLCFTNYISKRCDLYTHAVESHIFREDVFVLPPIDDGVGFDISINNFSIEKNSSINDLKSIRISSFPYKELSEREEYNPVNIPQEKQVMVLSQSFEKGWKAYEVENTGWINNIFPFVFGKEIKEHVLVNNWANGWVLNPQLSTLNSQLVIIFWPQYLEYFGLIFLGGTLLFLFIERKKI